MYHQFSSRYLTVTLKPRFNNSIAIVEIATMPYRGTCSHLNFFVGDACLQSAHIPELALLLPKMTFLRDYLRMYHQFSSRYLTVTLRRRFNN
ncbi:MAG TPA: hypothetical protein VE467_03175, partial [Chryseolinea sp.]|nr:hypothetical protein [Chryseolinea sp.]